MHTSRRTILRNGSTLLCLAACLLPASTARAERVHTATIQLREAPLVAIQYEGAYGPMRVSGTLTRPPQGQVRLRSADAKTRDVRWSDVTGMGRQVGYDVSTTNMVETGPLTATLVGENAPISPFVFAVGNPGFGGGLGGGLGSARPAWTVVSLPDSDLEIRGEPYGVLRVPAKKITNYSITPVSGTVTLPNVDLELLVAPDKTITIPLRDVQGFRRNENDVYSLLLGDQHFTGKLARVPDVMLEVDTNGMGKTVRVPLSRVSQMYITVSQVGPH